MATTTDVQTAQFSDEVLEASRPTLVDFHATWCGPCHRLAPVLDELASTNQDRLQVRKVDIDQSGDLAERYGISAVPTLVLIRDGEEIARTAGFQSRERLQAFLDQHLAA